MGALVHVNHHVSGSADRAERRALRKVAGPLAWTAISDHAAGLDHHTDILRTLCANDTRQDAIDETLSQRLMACEEFRQRNFWQRLRWLLRGEDA